LTDSLAAEKEWALHPESLTQIERRLKLEVFRQCMYRD
jgi:hypothetical protein